MARIAVIIWCLSCVVLSTLAVTTESPNVTTSTVPSDGPSSTFRPISECELGRLQPDEKQNRFQQLTQDLNGTDVWLIRNCQYPDLIFNFSLCACVFPRGSRCPYRALAEAQNRYQEVLFPYTNFTCDVSNTIWNQTGCQCDWNPNGPQAPALPDTSKCHPIFTASFDRGDNGGVQVVPYKPLRIVTGDGAEGGALATEPDTNVISYKVAFTSFGAGLIIDFRFRSKIDLAVNDEFVALVTNGCAQDETVAISYQASSRIYEVFVVVRMLRTRTANFMRFRCIDKSPVVDGFQWNKVSMVIIPGRLALVVNDVICHSQDMEPARPFRPQCPLVIGGDMQTSNRPRPKLNGFVDDISVRRYCRIRKL